MHRKRYSAGTQGLTCHAVCKPVSWVARILSLCGSRVIVDVFKLSRWCAILPIRHSVFRGVLLLLADLLSLSLPSIPHLKDDKKVKKGPVRGASCQLVYDFKKTLKAARKLRDSLDMIQYQLVEMHDR